MSTYNFETYKLSRGLAGLRSPTRSVHGSDKESISGRSRKGRSRQGLNYTRNGLLSFIV